MGTNIADDSPAIRKRMKELGLKGHTGVSHITPVSGEPLQWPNRDEFYTDYFHLANIRSVLRGRVDDLYCAFSWRCSREGELYWKRICNGNQPLDTEAVALLHAYIDDAALWTKGL